MGDAQHIGEGRAFLDVTDRRRAGGVGAFGHALADQDREAHDDEQRK